MLGIQSLILPRNPIHQQWETNSDHNERNRQKVRRSNPRQFEGGGFATRLG